MKHALTSRLACGPKADFKVSKEPFGLILRYLRTGYGLRPYRSPFVTVRAELVEAFGVWHQGFDKLSLALRYLRANGGGEPHPSRWSH
jgi:hypothetical protein